MTSTGKFFTSINGSGIGSTAMASGTPSFTVKRNVLPEPGTLLTQIRPPIS